MADRHAACRRARRAGLFRDGRHPQAVADLKALGVFGSATLWMAVFADMGASLLVVANGLRLLRHQA